MLNKKIMSNLRIQTVPSPLEGEGEDEGKNSVYPHLNPLPFRERMKKCKLLTAVLAFTLMLGQVSSARSADVYLSLSSHSSRSGLGIAGFYPQTPTVEESKAGREIQSVLTDDLLFSRYFNIIEGGSPFTGKIDDIKGWNSFGAAAVVAGSIKIAGEKISFRLQLYDLSSLQIIFENTYEANISDYRMLAHRANDDIIEHFIGKRESLIQK